MQLHRSFASLRLTQGWVGCRAAPGWTHSTPLRYAQGRSGQAFEGGRPHMSWCRIAK
ncbi:hypothetical protein SBA1_230017 [Candidatus Sulfotelmatobacter kueseliae]|uniref:Uncharacterized protein n=1 Tax=Candidatus Sulfotelmatobacter kueseliae TaxID=2042962 RepID=A0A2U3KH01_9BACT|nr:hypothetical protein SBA1_230017 [Candidatus Sulfotelmatobacter kueseliae]